MEERSDAQTCANCLGKIAKQFYLPKMFEFLLYSFEGTNSHNRISGDDGRVVPPVPMPNTVVKHTHAESTCLETGWENRTLPVKQRHSLHGGCFFVLLLRKVDFSLRLR